MDTVPTILIKELHAFCNHGTYGVDCTKDEATYEAMAEAVHSPAMMGPNYYLVCGRSLSSGGNLHYV